MVEVSAGLNIAGLIADIIGAYLVFRFALMPMGNDKDHHVLEPGGKHIPVETYRSRALCGIWLLIGGFGVQVLGNSVVFWI